MAVYTVAVHSKVQHLRWKYGDNKKLQEALDRVLWWSFPRVYTSFALDVVSVHKSLSAQYARRKRVRLYVKKMVASFDRIFLASLTFNDDVLASTTQKTRERYIREWLNTYCCDYFACIDFGAVNGREHYHALVVFNLKVDLTCFVGKRKKVYYSLADPSVYPYGFSSFSLLNTDNNIDVSRTLNYAFKASNYAFKSSDSKYKPFHKRGVNRWLSLSSDLDLPY